MGRISDVMFSRTRAVIMLDAPGARPSSSQQPATALTLVQRIKGSPATSSAAARPEKPLDTVRIAVLSNQRDLLKGLERREVKFDIVGSNENPDLVWDASSFDVLAGSGCDCAQRRPSRPAERHRSLCGGERVQASVGSLRRKPFG